MFQEFSQLDLLHPELSDTERVRNELAALQQELAHNLELVSKLKEVQNKFLDLWQVYQDAKQFFDLALETFGSIQEKSHNALAEMYQQKQVIDQRLQTITTKSESLHKSLLSTAEKHQKEFAELHALVQTTTVEQKRNFDQALQSLTTTGETKLNELRYAFQQERNSLLHAKEQVQLALTATHKQNTELTQIFQTLSTTNEERWRSFEAVLFKVKSDLSTTTESTRTDLEKQIDENKKKYAIVIENIDGLQLHFEAFKQETSLTLQKMKQSERDVQVRLVALQNSFRMRTRWIGTVAITALLFAVILSGYVLGPFLIEFALIKNLLLAW
jgi:chromosome segregation ATPase